MKCPVCDSIYQKKGHLTNHIARIHPHFKTNQHKNASKPHKSSIEPEALAPESLHNFHDLRAILRHADSIFEKAPEHEPLEPPNTRQPPHFHQNHDPVSTSATQHDRPEPAYRTHEDDPPIIKIYPHAGGIVSSCHTKNEARFLKSVRPDNHYHPFAAEWHYYFANWLVKNQVSATAVDELLKHPSIPLGRQLQPSFSSYHRLKSKINDMGDDYIDHTWQRSTLAYGWPDAPEEKISFYHRDPIDIARWLLSQPAYQAYMRYAPVFKEHRLYDDVTDEDTGKTRRVYEDMETCDYWHEKQSEIPIGGTLVPIILMSDTTHLTNFSGDKKAWPIYMTIGNLASEARTKPSLNTSVLLCLLPIPQKMQEMTAGMKKRFQTEHRRIFTEILSHILRCLNLSDDEGAFYSLCTDGNTRVCYLRLAAWIADYPEHITIQGLAYGVCQWCEVPKKMLGNCPKRNQRPAKRRNHAEYARRWTKGTEKDDDWLTEHGVRPAENTLWWLKYCDLADFPKPDILHTLLLGMFKHLLTWLHAMLKQHGRMQRFDTIWLKVPAYLEMGSPKKRYSEVSQWQGKEIKTMCRFLYCVTVAALDAPKASEKQSFSDAIQATKALIEILMFSTYRSHDAETIDMLHEAVVRFHDHKNVFLQYRAGIKVSKDATDRRKELNAERDAELAITTSAAEKKRIRQAWATFIEWEMRATLEENSHFNFPKLHMLQHWAEQIRRFGNIPQWDTNTGEAAHKMVKEGYRMSNRSGDYTLQILRHNMKTVAFSMRELNNTARGRKIVQVKTNFEQKDDDPVILPSESLDPSKAPAQFIGPYMPTGRSAINTVRKVIKNANVPCFDAAYQEYVTDVRQEEWNEHHYMNAAAVLYSGIELYMQQFATGNWEIRRMRCTASRKWHGGAPRADWVWLDLGLAKTKTSERRQRRQPAGLYGALQGRIPCKLRCLFKVALPNADGRIVDEHLALVEVVYPLQNGNVDNNTGLVTVVRPDPENPHHRGFMGQLEEGVTYRVFPACDIVGPAHLIPLQAENTTSWLINPHIDIQTWNTVY